MRVVELAESVRVKWCSFCTERHNPRERSYTTDLPLLEVNTMAPSDATARKLGMPSQLFHAEHFGYSNECQVSGMRATRTGSFGDGNTLEIVIPDFIQVSWPQ